MIESIFILFAVGAGFAASAAAENAARKPIEASKGARDYLLVTGDDGQGSAERLRWDAVFNTTQYVYGREPAEFLTRVVHRLPVGKALDIAMGEGRNAVFLAKKGFSVDGVDISEVALSKARRLARENHISIQTINADLNSYRIRPETYDVIVNINYLQRSLVSQIKKGLRPGGVVVFENWTVDQLKKSGGQSLPRDFLLKRGELRRLFEDFEVLYYSETDSGQDALASLVARRPLH